MNVNLNNNTNNNPKQPPLDGSSPIQRLPEEILSLIFSDLHISAIKNATCFVNKSCKKISQDLIKTNHNQNKIFARISRRSNAKKSKNYDEIIKILKEKGDLISKPNRAEHENWRVLFRNIIYSLRKGNDTKLNYAENIIAHIPYKGAKHASLTYLTAQLIEQDKIDRVVTLIKNFKESFGEDSISWIVQQLVARNKIEQAQDIANNMLTEEKKIKSLHFICASLAHLGKIEEVKEMLKTFSVENIHHSNSQSILRALVKAGNLKKALKLLEKMPAVDRNINLEMITNTLIGENRMNEAINLNLDSAIKSFHETCFESGHTGFVNLEKIKSLVNTIPESHKREMLTPLFQQALDLSPFKNYSKYDIGKYINEGRSYSINYSTAREIYKMIPNADDEIMNALNEKLKAQQTKNTGKKNH